jgi:hypothetical protein
MKLAIITTAFVFAATAAFAQAGPPHGKSTTGDAKPIESQDQNKPNVSGSQSGPAGTTGMKAPDTDGVKGNVNPGSQKSGSEPAGQPAAQPRQ